MVPMTNVTSSLLVYGTLAVLLTMLGGWIPLWRRWKEDHLHHFVSFSAGVLIATAFLHLLPDAIPRTEPFELGLCILVSFVGLFILEKFIMLHPCEETHCDYHTMGVAAFVGMLIHTFFDGLALGAALFVEGLGPVVFFAIMVHKIPSSFSLSSILRKAGWSSKRIMFFIFMFGMVIPIGAVASLFILDVTGANFIGVGISLSLGTFLYISTSDFLPEVHRAHTSRIRNLVAFLTGIVVIAAVSIWLPVG